MTTGLRSDLRDPLHIVGFLLGSKKLLVDLGCLYLVHLDLTLLLFYGGCG